MNIENFIILYFHTLTIYLTIYILSTDILLEPTAKLSDHLMHAVLSLLQREISDHGRHLPHYFSLFHMYANLGLQEKLQLLTVNFYGVTLIR